MKTPLLLALAGACAVLSPGCSQGDTNVSPVVDLRADVNRNGVIDWDDPTEDDAEDTWDQAHGAIFLANIDDDENACPKTTSSGGLLSDSDLAKCNDAQDTVVNGDADALDLAPLGVRPWPGAPDGTTASLTVDAKAAPYVHLFVQRGGALTFFDWQNGDVLSTDEVRAGATLAIEGTDVVRDASVWNGYATITLTIGAVSDVVEMREAPIVTRHHLADEERVFVTAYSDDTGSIALRSTLYSDMAGNGEGSGTTVGPVPSNVTEIDGNATFGGQYPYDDQWTQDLFEVGYMSMPIAGGQQHVIDVYLRSPNIYYSDPQNPLRDAGKVVFTMFRGPDAAGVQQFDMNADPNMDSLNSFGNLETVPPYSLGGNDYPLGRVFQGSVPSFHPDGSFETMMDAQSVQPAVHVDTSWLDVGHVDETISFVKTSSPRGWAMLVADPTLAKQMLQDQSTAGNGATLMFAGKSWLDANSNEVPAQATIDEVLADTDVMTSSDQAAAAIDAQVQILEQETGITDAEIIHVPFLFQSTQGYLIAYQPGTVNGLYYAGDTFAAPDPHGPVINGKDIFKDQLEQALATVGVDVVWVEDWDLYHRLTGEVHCGTNSKRGLLPGEQWWTSGY
jgi:protein-arginine deiminase